MVKNSFYSRVYAAIVACALILAIIPIANAFAADSIDANVTSTRSFPKVNNVKRDLFTEAVFTDVDSDSHWGGIESLKVPQTKSEAERNADAERLRILNRQNAYSEAASRNSDRGSVNRSSSSREQYFTVDPPDERSSEALLNFAAQFVGKVPYVWGGTTTSGWDCSGFVGYVYSKMGVDLPRTARAQAQVGKAVASLDEAHPGDIIASSSHAAIYVGNGMIVNAQNNGTQYAPLRQIFRGSYSIRRIL